MKCLVVFFLAACLQAPSNGYAQKISLSEKNASLQKVFRNIEKQSGYLFWYEYSLLQQVKKINVNARNLSLSEALDLCLKDQPLMYTIVKKTIVITQKPENTTEASPLSLLPIEIAGRVTDSIGEPLEGVSVSIAGINRGVMTGRDGNFRVEAQPDALLHFSLVSYQPADIAVRNKAVINVMLRADHSSLNDVVVIGYGSLSKRNLTGSVSSIGSREIDNQPLASADLAIAGQAAGVRVSQLTGVPGGGATIRVRGTSSISAGNEPLYVIDGFPVEGEYNRDMNPLATINPNDVESMQILKDASSVAIYGSRGSNGVVLINTKRGKTDKALIQFNSYYGIQQAANKIDMLDAGEYAAYNTEARNNAWMDTGGNADDPNSVRPDRMKIPPMFADPSSLGAGTNWQDEVFRSAPVQNHQVSVFNGSEGTQYMLSAGYFNQKGVVINTGFERYSLRFNFDSKLSKKIKIGLTIAPTYSKNDVLPVDDQVFLGGILGSALAMPPTVPVFDEDGAYTTLLATSPYNIGIIDNPVAMANQIKGGTSAFRTLANLFAEWEIIKGLKLKSSFGGDLYEDRYSFYWPTTLGRNGATPPIIA
ncbi:MAG: SusC/RagA family TonB-linked outer membrane protein, partial [Flavitalea sp.]